MYIDRISAISHAVPSGTAADVSIPLPPLSPLPQGAEDEDRAAVRADTVHISSMIPETVPDGTGLDPSARILWASLTPHEGYTIEDAVQRHWQAVRPAVTIQGLMDGTFTKRDLLGDLSGILDGLRSGTTELAGFGDEGRWRQLEQALSGPQIHPVGEAAPSLGARIDAFAARTAAAETVIRAGASGEERERQLLRLRETADAAAQELAAGYAERIGGFLERNGADGEIDKIASSVLRLIGERTRTYRSAVDESEDLARAAGTGDAWLLKDDAYVASVLARTVDRAGAERPDGAAYSMADLTTLESFIKELGTVRAYHEERLGLDLAMVSMKVDTLGKSGAVGTELFRTLRTATDGWMRNMADAFREEMDARRSRPLLAADRRGFAAVDTAAIWSVYQRTMRSYEVLGDALRALRSGAEHGKELYLSKMEERSGIYRFGSGISPSSYWSSFFEPDAPASRLRLPYALWDRKDGGTTYDRYAAGWDDFLRSLEEGGPIRFDLALRPADAYPSAAHADVRA